MYSLIGEKRFSQSQQNIVGMSAEIPRLADKGLNSIISVNPTFKLYARLTFKNLKTFENGRDYQLTNWIDCEETEFVGLSYGKIALHYNSELQENYIYCITNAVVSIIAQDNSRIPQSKGLTLNKQTMIERVNSDAAEFVNFPNISYLYKSIEDILTLDQTIENQRIDFIGIFSDWVEERKQMSLITPTGNLIVHVEKAISQVCHEDFIEMVGLPYCATVSFKALQMDGDVFSCFNDTIIKINRFCPQSHELADWLEDTFERNEPYEENWSNGSSDDSGVFGLLDLPNPNVD